MNYSVMVPQKKMILNKKCLRLCNRTVSSVTNSVCIYSISVYWQINERPSSLKKDKITVSDVCLLCLVVKE